MKILQFTVACVIAVLAGAAVGKVIKVATNQDSCGAEKEVAADVGYIAGCTMAFHAVHGDRHNDPLDPYWVAWCQHNAAIFSQDISR